MSTEEGGIRAVRSARSPTFDRPRSGSELERKWVTRV